MVEECVLGMVAYLALPDEAPAPHALSVTPRMTPSTWYFSWSRSPATSISILSWRGPARGLRARARWCAALLSFLGFGEKRNRKYS